MTVRVSAILSCSFRVWKLSLCGTLWCMRTGALSIQKHRTLCDVLCGIIMVSAAFSCINRQLSRLIGCQTLLVLSVLCWTW